jgi:hypothetical protein
MADQLWQLQSFPAPNGEQAAVKFLNEPFRQGRSEAAATFRNDDRGAAVAGAGQAGGGHQADLAVQGLPRAQRRGGGPGVPERDPAAGGR